MSDHPSEGAFAADLALIGRVAEELRLSWWPGDADTVAEIGDLENASVLARVGGAARLSQGAVRHCSTRRGESIVLAT